MSDLKRTRSPGPVGGLSIPTWVVPKNSVGGPRPGQSNTGMPTKNNPTPSRKK